MTRHRPGRGGRRHGRAPSSSAVPRAVLHVGLAGQHRLRRPRARDRERGALLRRRLAARPGAGRPGRDAASRRPAAAWPDARFCPIGTSARVGGTHGCAVEAMEGFAVLRACALAGVPALEVRVTSNGSASRTAASGSSTRRWRSCGRRSRGCSRRSMPELPPPLPPGERTVMQLVAETIRLYGDNFWRALPLGLPLAVAYAARCSGTRRRPDRGPLSRCARSSRRVRLRLGHRARRPGRITGASYSPGVWACWSGCRRRRLRCLRASDARMARAVRARRAGRGGERLGFRARSRVAGGSRRPTTSTRSARSARW